MRRLILALSVVLAVGAAGCTTVDGRHDLIHSPGPSSAAVRQLVPDGTSEPVPTPSTTSPAPVQAAAREALVDIAAVKPHPAKKPKKRARHPAPARPVPVPEAAGPRRPAGQADRPAPVWTPAERRTVVRPAAPPRRATVPRHRTVAPKPKPRSTYADLGVVCGWSKQAGVDPALTAACRRTAH
ncbi:hypothetical protein [Streptomyces sp. NPDC088785]|uniref:hypothetical protein n=1 Tax=Streptomyces sp. NPDC088785 TaxID=3365897 RepID=UPI00380BA32E